MNKKPFIVTLSNGKGGVGKTTYSMHLISAFLMSGLKVLSVDLDERQHSLSSYIENRTRYRDNHPDENILLSEHYLLKSSKKNEIKEIVAEEFENLMNKINDSKSNFDVIVIDTPGDFSHRSILAHGIADVVVSPINDSFLDMSVLCKIDENLKIHGPSVYSMIAWEEKIKRAKNKNKAFEWFVIRNRINHTDTIGGRKISTALDELSKRLGFKTASGFSDRVIFKDLFLHGLTILDVGRASSVKSFTPNNLAAKLELKAFLSGTGLNKLIKN